MTCPAWRGLAAASAVFVCACSNGTGGPAAVTEPGLRVLAVTPATYEWAPVGTPVALTFNRALDPASVWTRTLVVQRRGGGEVAGTAVVEGATLHWRPAEPLGEGWYELVPRHDVRGLDGSEWNTLDAVRVEFAVRRDLGTWSAPVNLGTAGPDAPLLVEDPLGGAALAWLAGGDVWVAEFDRDRGWSPAVAVVPVPTSAEPTRLLAARGSATMAVAIVQAHAGFQGQSAVRLSTSRTFDLEGRRVWNRPVVSFLELLAQPPELHVDAAGGPLMLLVSPSGGQQVLRMVRFADFGLVSDEPLSAIAHEVAVERVDYSVLGDVAVTWRELDVSGVRRLTRIARRAGLDVATPMAAIGAPRGGGFDQEGNAWLLLPATTATMRLRVQTAQRWQDSGVELPYGLAFLSSFALDLLTLDWRSEGGLSTLSANRVDRLGRALSSTTLYGPTREDLTLLAFHGDPDRGALAVWRGDAGIHYSRLQRGPGDATAWTSARRWEPDHAPVPIERAVITPAGRGRTYFTFVDQGRLATTYDEPGRDMPRPVRNLLDPTDGDPLRASILRGTSRGRLLLVTRSGSSYQGQWIE